MTEEYWAEQFGREVDRLIGQTERTPTTAAPRDYTAALNFARDLAQVDYSVESRQRERVRRRLIDQAQRAILAGKERHLHTLRLRRALTFSIVGTILVCALTLSVFYPGGIAAAARNLYDVIRTIMLGDYTRAVQTTANNGGEPAALLPDMWKIRTEIGNFAGNAPPGVDPIVRSVTTLAEAQSIASFHLLTPSDLPAGYALREVQLAPIGGTHWVLSFYGGHGHDIIIVQMPIGSQPSQQPNELTGIGSGLFTDGKLEETDLDGRKAVWAEGHALMWQAAGLSYIVGGLDLTLDDAKQIARSLH